MDANSGVKVTSEQVLCLLHELDLQSWEAPRHRTGLSMAGKNTSFFKAAECCLLYFEDLIWSLNLCWNRSNKFLQLFTQVVCMIKSVFYSQLGKGREVCPSRTGEAQVQAILTASFFKQSCTWQWPDNTSGQARLTHTEWENFTDNNMWRQCNS